MSSTFAFIRDLAASDIRLRLEGEALRINAPEGALTPNLVAELKARKPAIIEFLSAHQTALVMRIEAQKRPEHVPLSFSQQRLWFLTQLEGPSATYNIPNGLRLRGAVDVEALRASWEHLVVRHEILRTTFQEVDGQAHQVVGAARFDLQEIDLSPLDPAARERELLVCAEREATEPFGLERGPLWRVMLVKLAAREHVMLVTMHHIISDGWSMGVLTREFMALYDDHVRGRVTQLPELPLQYADYAVWQRQRREEPATTASLEYWRAQLEGAPSMLPLPTDRPHPAEQSYRSGQLDVVIPKRLLRALESLSRACGATLFMTCEAAFAVLMMRYSGVDDICVGTPIANRQHGEIEGLIGFFVNTLVLRNNLSGDPSFREFLARVRTATIDAYDHQAVPFELVVEALQPERTLSHSPLFQVMFGLQNAPAEELALAGLDVSGFDVPGSPAKFDLTLLMQELGGELTASWRYKSDLFDAPTIERMAGHFHNLLGDIVAAPDRSVSTLKLLSSRERQQLLVAFNDTRVAYPEDKCVHQLVEAQVRRTPDAVAIDHLGALVTYRELNGRANRVARLLLARGVKPGELVGVCARRSVELLVGLLGVLKAGGAYLPLDPEYPAARLRYMIEDAGVRRALVQTEELAAHPELCELETIVLDGAIADGADEGEDPCVSVTPDDLAYVIYTSGSTGQPKGVQVAHRGVVNYLCWFVETVPVVEGHGVPILGSYAFDGTVPTLFAPLLVGQRLLMLPGEEPGGKDAIDALCARLEEHTRPLTMVKATPTVLRAVAEIVREAEGDANPKMLVAGGELLLGETVRQWRKLAPGLRVFNQYGPTEATVACCFHEVRGDEEGAGPVPIGRPIANAQVYVLDRNLQPVPVGVPGELYVGGVQLARGYLNRPELTAARFIRNPFVDGWLYRSGDVCRHRPGPDGAPDVLEYLRRCDDQVKVRGHRVELGEIEEQLRQVGDVRAAAAVVRTGPRSEQLVGYVVVDGKLLDLSPSALASRLRCRLARRVPSYMIPSAFVRIDEVPRTPSGKLDRRALPSPEAQRVDPRRLAPRSAGEVALLEIWRDVLGVGSLGITDNFFQAGGDSILSIQVVSRARDAGIALTPKALFQHQTIAKLAASLESIEFVRAEQGPVTGAVPLTPNQLRFFEQGWSEPHHFNVPLLIELAPDARVDLLQESLSALLHHHDALRQRFERREGVWRQEVSPPGSGVPFEVVELSGSDEHEDALARSAKIEAVNRSLELARGPLIRAVLFEARASRSLLIVIHHLVADGFSCRILLEDLQRVYRQLDRSDAVSLPPKTTSFKRWTTLLHERGPQLVASERAFWSAVAAAAADAPRLPVDHRLGVNDNASLGHVVSELDRESTTALLSETAAAYRTKVSEVLLVALLQTFAEWTGRPSLRVELEAHGREDIFATNDRPAVDLSRSVGWFTATYPVVLEAGSSELDEVIKRVKEQLRQVPNRGLGYGLLRYLDAPPLGPAALDVTAEVHFNYIGRFEPLSGGSPLRSLVLEQDDVAESPSGERPYLIDINCVAVDGRLRVYWLYSRNFFREETIQGLARGFAQTLDRLIEHCLGVRGAYTPSDFREAAITQEGLDTLVEEVERARGSEGRVPIELEAVYPLAPSQHGMLLESVLAPGEGLHIEQSLFRWHGSLDVELLRAAWGEVLARHPALCSGIVWDGLDRPLQYVERHVEMPIELRSLGGRPPAAQREHIDRYLAEDRRRGFDLRRAPLTRLAVFATGDDEHELVWTRYHAVTDAWSVGLIGGELLSIYRAMADGRAHELAPCRPYVDYIRWLGARPADDSEAFWRASLRGFSAPTAIATRMASASGARSFGRLDVSLSPALSEALTLQPRAHSLTSNTLLRAAWALTLREHSGASDVLFGTTVSGRPPEIEGVERMVGLFANTLPTRVCMTVAAGASLRGWLRDLQRDGLEQLLHAYCSSGQVHQWSEVPAALPLYESLLVLENLATEAPADLLAAELVAREGSRSIGARTKYALTILIVPGAGVELRAIYDGARLEERDVEGLLSRFGENLERLLRALERAPEQPLVALVAATGDRSAAVALRPNHARSPERLVYPRSEVEATLLAIWQEVLGVDEISVRDNFFELGGHSLVAARLLAAVQERCGLRLSLAALVRDPTIEALARRLAQPRDLDEAWPTVVQMQIEGDRSPFFCLPGGGGNVLYLHELARLMGTDRPFYSLQAVGLDGRVAPLETVEAIATHSVEEILRVQPRGPYVLGGHSFGGLVAYEAAARLRARGHEVARLVLLDTTVPVERLCQPLARWDAARWMVEVARTYGQMLGESTALARDELAPLDDGEQLDRFARELVRLQLLPASADAEQARGWVNVFRANMLTNYMPRQRMPAPITLVRAIVPIERDPALDGGIDDHRLERMMGWERFSEGPLEVIEVPGDHITMLARPHVDVVAARLVESLRGCE